MRMAVLEGLEWIFAAPAAPLPATVSDVRNNERLDAVFKGRGLIGLPFSFASTASFSYLLFSLKVVARFSKQAVSWQ